MDFFVKAAIVHTWLGDEDAKLAALVSGKIVPKRQRNSMSEYVKTMAAILVKLDQGYEVYAKRLLGIYMDLSEGEWSVADIEDAKRRLRGRNSEYADALDKGDAGVFVEKYPQLFEVDTPADLGIISFSPYLMKGIMFSPVENSGYPSRCLLIFQSPLHHLADRPQGMVGRNTILGEM